MKSLQFHKLVRQHNESAEYWTARFRIVSIECNYKAIGRQLTEESRHGLNDLEMLAEIIRELTTSDENEIMLTE